MEKVLAISLLTLVIPSAFAYNVGESLSGDTKLACEAVLCLSSSTRPDECSPSLDRYFGIKHKKLSDTINARINFLNQCPASNESNMPSLIRAVANGAGRCDAEYLNRFNTEIYYKKTCARLNSFSDESCKTERISVISDEKPYYCTAYDNHEFTDLNTRYLGEKFKDGRWYDGEDYDKALADYNQSKGSNSVVTTSGHINSRNSTATYTSEYDVNRQERQSR